MEQEVTKINTSALYNQYHRMVYDIVIGFEDDWQLQDDLAQDCWVRILEQIAEGKYEDQGHKIGTWITHVTKNHCINYLEAKAADKRRMVMYEHELAGHNPHDDFDSEDEHVESLVEMPDLETPYDVYAAEQTVTWIEDNLTDAQLEVLRMAADGMDQAQIAEELGISQPAVYYRLEAARTKVADYIGE